MAQKWNAHFVPFNQYHWSTFYERAYAGQMIETYVQKLGRCWLLLKGFESNERMLKFEAQIVPEPGKTPLENTRNAWFEGEYNWETMDGWIILPHNVRKLPKVELAPWIAAQATVSQTTA